MGFRFCRWLEINSKALLVIFPPINLWSLPKQLKDYMLIKTNEETIMITDHEKTRQKVESSLGYKPEVVNPYNRYFKDVSNLKAIDVYKVLELFEVKSHAIGHAVKKLLAAGSRGAKDEKQDIQEAIASLKRHLEILEGK